MTKQPKFTPGPWHKSTFEDDWAIRGAKCNRIIAKPNCNFDDASANASLIAQCPSLYANEEKNLELLKITLATYAEIYKLVLTDADVHACMGNITPDDVHWIVLTLKERVETTEKLLAKCRGEKTDA